jgi:uncharacterized protein involved in outer membrane biogenesis
MRAFLKFSFIALGLVLIALGLSAILFVSRAQVARHGLEETLTYCFGAETSVESLAIAPSLDAVELKGLTVANPPNFPEGTAITAEKIRISFDLASLLQETPTLSLIRVEGAHFHLRHSLGQGVNLGQLAKHAVDLAGSTDGPRGAQRKVIINRLEVEDAKLSLDNALLPEDALALEVPSIAIDDVGGDAPISTGQAGAEILQRVLSESLSLQGVMKPLADALQNELGSLGEAATP